MREATLTKWGNSAGIRISAEVIKKAHLYIGEKLMISVTRQGELLIKPSADSKEEWLMAFNAIADAKQDDRLIGDVENDFDRNEWVW